MNRDVEFGNSALTLRAEPVQSGSGVQNSKCGGSPGRGGEPQGTRGQPCWAQAHRPYLARTRAVPRATGSGVLLSSKVTQGSGLPFPPKMLPWASLGAFTLH